MPYHLIHPTDTDSPAITAVAVYGTEVAPSYDPAAGRRIEYVKVPDGSVLRHCESCGGLELFSGPDPTRASPVLHCSAAYLLWLADHFSAPTFYRLLRPSRFTVVKLRVLQPRPRDATRSMPVAEVDREAEDHDGESDEVPVAGGDRPILIFVRNLTGCVILVGLAFGLDALGYESAAYVALFMLFCGVSRTCFDRQ